MSKNSVDSNQSKASGAPTEYMLPEEIAKLNRPKLVRKRILIASTLTAAIAAIVFWPRENLQRDLDEPLKKSQSARFAHKITMDSTGKKVSEDWSSDNKFVSLSFNSKGEVVSESRTDGNEQYSYYNLPKSSFKNPNQENYGSVTKGWARTHGPEEHNALFNYGKYEALSKESITTPRGPATRFRVNNITGVLQEMLLTVDNKTKLIVETSGPRQEWLAKIDYPESIPGAMFEPRPQSITGVEVFNHEDQLKEATATAAKGLGTAHGVTLRLVTMDDKGEVWAFWSGDPETGKSLAPITFGGFKHEPPFTFLEYISGAEHPLMMKDGTKVYGKGCKSLSKVGTHVDIAIPTKSGVATFNHVPVMRNAGPGSIVLETVRGM